MCFTLGRGLPLWREGANILSSKNGQRPEVERLGRVGVCGASDDLCLCLRGSPPSKYLGQKR